MSHFRDLSFFCLFPGLDHFGGEHNVFRDWPVVSSRAAHLRSQLRWGISLGGTYTPRSPSSALSPFVGGGLPCQNRLQKEVGTFILTSLVEDLDIPTP